MPGVVNIEHAAKYGIQHPVSGKEPPPEYRDGHRASEQSRYIVESPIKGNQSQPLIHQHRDGQGEYQLERNRDKNKPERNKQ